ncbi:hypothetical protein C0991_009044 [Blastosporella zonata]|nr:hypothetical protein C0991_009044 [Blastosporella zonata]
MQEELSLPYEIKRYQRGPDRLAPKELLEINPLGKSPVITDDSVTLAESGAIVVTHYAEGSLMPLCVQKITYDMVPQRTPLLIRPVASVIFKNLTQKLLIPAFEKHFALVMQNLLAQLLISLHA